MEMNAIVQFPAIPPASPDAAALQALLEACPWGMLLADGERIVYANAAFAQMMGFASGQGLEGRNPEEFFPQLARQRSAISPGEQTVQASRGDGSKADLRICSANVQANERELLAMSARPAEAQQTVLPSPDAERLEALGRLTGGVAHDFNNLLTGILLSCDLLLAGLGGQEPLAGYVREIRQAGLESSGLVAQLMSCVRQPGEQSTGSSWQEVIEGMRSLLRRLLGENIELAVEFAEEEGELAMDAVHMRQIVLNLVLNARDAMPEGGRITVAVRNHAPEFAGAPPDGAGSVELTVADCGCGMDARTRARLFEPFFTTKPHGRGNGLGLATVRRLAEQHRGSVGVTSRVGRGTQVSVWLPCIGRRRRARSQENQR